MSFIFGAFGGNNNDNKRKEKEPEQMQSQRRVQNTKQLIRERQTFQEQVYKTFKCIIMPAKMSQNASIDKGIVDSLTDGAMLSLDLLIIACNEFRKESDEAAIALATKTVHDNWNELKIEDPTTYDLTTEHRDFILAALTGENNEEFTANRVDPSQKKLFENDAPTICTAFAHSIHNSSKFDKKQESYLESEKNKQFKLEQDAALNEYHKNKNKYNRNNNGRKQDKYSRPHPSKLYFTESGKKATFKDPRSEIDEKSMNDELMGGVESAYDKIPQNYPYQNVLVNLSQFRLSKKTPCKILYPKNRDEMETILVEPAYPFNKQRLNIPFELIDFDEENIKQKEDKHIKKHGTLGKKYKSIKQQYHEMMQMDVDDE